MTVPPNQLPPDEAGLLPLVNAILRRRRTVLLVPLGLAFLVVVIGLILPRHYTASARFSPQTSGNSLSQLSGLAARFGLAVPGDDATQSPDFYADLLRSAELRRALVESTYVVRRDRDSVRLDLIQIYDIHEATPGRSREKAVRRLGEHLSVTTDLKTGVVSFSIEAEQPQLARALVEGALALVNDFNLRTRSSQAAAERRFVEGRLQQAERELRESEDRLQAFLTANRTFSNSPQLQFQHDRLQRDVLARQEVYNSLAQSFEQARIEEVRNTPVVTVVEGPITPVKPDSRKLLFKAVLALVIGGLLVVVAVVLLEGLTRTRIAAPDEYHEYLRLRGELARDLRHPWRLLRRAGGSDAFTPHGTSDA